MSAGAGRGVGDFLVRLRPRGDTLYVSQGRAVWASDRDGMIRGGREHGLFVYETRLLSRYVLTVDDERPEPVALSNVEQHSWLGYFIRVPPGVDAGEEDSGSGLMQAAARQTLELRVSRYVGGGVHEDLDLTNYATEPTRFRFALEVEADFADVEETARGRRQHGVITRLWRDFGESWELRFDYAAAPTAAGGPRRAHIVGILRPQRRAGGPPALRAVQFRRPCGAACGSVSITPTRAPPSTASAASSSSRSRSGRRSHGIAASTSSP
jgi:hypothetical protein